MSYQLQPYLHSEMSGMPARHQFRDNCELNSQRAIFWCGAGISKLVQKCGDNIWLGIWARNRLVLVAGVPSRVPMLQPICTCFWLGITPMNHAPEFPHRLTDYPQQVAEFKIVFQMFDADQSGTIVSKELYTVMRTLGQETSEEIGRLALCCTSVSTTPYSVLIRNLASCFVVCLEFSRFHAGIQSSPPGMASHIAIESFLAASHPAG